MTGAIDPFQLVGQTLDGVYRLDRLVGEGGFGVVYRGFHLAFEQPVAVKCLKLPPEMSSDTREAFLRKFREEGRLLYQLSQESLGIVRSIALGDTVSPNGIWTPFVVLEWLDGTSLASDLEQRRAARLQGRPLNEVLSLLEVPARALAHAHELRVAHRDIKPANLHVLPARKPGAPPTLKVLDFGIAKVMEEGANAQHANATAMGFQSFTPEYASPEQFNPTFGSTGPWSDVYSFALVVAEMLTDRPWCEEEDAIKLMIACTQSLSRPTPRRRGANIPDSVEAVFRRALSVPPTERQPDLAVFWQELVGAARASATPASLVALPASFVPGTPPMAPSRAAPWGPPATGPFPPAMSAPAPSAPAPFAPSHPGASMPFAPPTSPSAGLLPPRAPMPSCDAVASAPMVPRGQQPWSAAPASAQPLVQMPAPAPLQISYPNEPWLAAPAPPIAPRPSSGLSVWIPVIVLVAIVLLVTLGGLMCTCLAFI